jgi:hypothetical protein
MTEIGERGINMSGGQKQRISLARAVYADSDIYLIDDALSALDAFVGKKIFDNVFATRLKSKTVVIVTHAIQYLPYCDNCYLMDKGAIVARGKFYDIKKTSQYHEYVSEVKETLEKQSRVSMAKSKAATGISHDPSTVLHAEIAARHVEYESSDGGSLISEDEDFDFNAQIQKNQMMRQDSPFRYGSEPPLPGKATQELGQSTQGPHVDGSKVHHLQSKVIGDDDDLLEPDFDGDHVPMLPKKKRGKKQKKLDSQEAEIIRLQQVILECERKFAAKEAEVMRKDLDMLNPDQIDINHDGVDEFNTHHLNPEKIDLKQPSMGTRKTAGSLLKTESRFTGQIPMAVWKFWFAAGGTCLNISNFTLHIIIVVMMLAQDWWVGIWAVKTYDLSQGMYVIIFAVICLIVIVGTGVRFRIFGQQVASASLKIYIGLIANLLRRPMSFFDTTPVGQILNRCGKDADDMDATFPFTLNAFMG